MKYIETDDLSELTADGRGRLITDADTFTFRCHPGISCFNLCCRNLNLFLHPYDVVRLKKNLNTQRNPRRQSPDPVHSEMTRPAAIRCRRVAVLRSATVVACRPQESHHLPTR